MQLKTDLSEDYKLRKMNLSGKGRDRYEVTMNQ